MDSLSWTFPINLVALDKAGIQGLVATLGWPAFRAQQILRWIYRNRIRSIDQMTNLSYTQREHLQRLATIKRLHPPRVLTSRDGTQKFLFPVDGGQLVESVLIPDGRRKTLCVSTQVGCTLDCVFCLTGQIGLQRNLTAAEIVDQVLTVQDYLGKDGYLSSIVFMGMGEPLANLTAVSDAIERLTNSTWGVGLSPRRITISTAGLVPRLHHLARLGVNLAISLNATTNAQRDRLMPAVNRLYPLEDLLAACRAYPLPNGRRLTFEYVLLAGENDSDQDARRLATLVRGIRCKINLIPFNEVPGSPFRRPDESTILRFQSILRAAGYHVFIRKSRGVDVLGACGQLGRENMESRIPLLVGRHVH
ncbi:MAG: 23S rRNA (adenine(2503)-C(2))-methyltransferase RlmN [Nitrospirae bacterium]|nr:MAG: 23S rRNA (adenine(2503)-C(2))-methyltransferase RlmN [Nitrospirota bacterium]